MTGIPDAFGMEEYCKLDPSIVKVIVWNQKLNKYNQHFEVDSGNRIIPHCSMRMPKVSVHKLVKKPSLPSDTTLGRNGILRLLHWFLGSPSIQVWYQPRLVFYLQQLARSFILSTALHRRRNEKDPRVLASYQRRQLLQTTPQFTIYQPLKFK